MSRAKHRRPRWELPELVHPVFVHYAGQHRAGQTTSPRPRPLELFMARWWRTGQRLDAALLEAAR